MILPSSGAQAQVQTARGLRVVHPCPQCGGEVELGEGDRLLSCPYCRVRLYMVPEGGVARFYLPPKPSITGDLVFAPYWRVRGPAFMCVASRIEHSILDATSRAVGDNRLPQTLGVRPQAMKLKYVTPETKGLFLALSVARPTRNPVPAELTDPDRKETIYHEGFLAAVSSVIYLPLQIRDGGLYDAVRDARLGEMPFGARADSLGPVDTTRDFGVKFLPTLCPECGWDMAGSGDSMVAICATCAAAWEARTNAWARTRSAVMRVLWEPQLHLPFWRLQAKTAGVPLDSAADLARLANLPRIVDPADEKREIRFWAPAFKLQPDHYLRLAKTMTIRRPDPDDLFLPGSPRGNCHPVSIPLECAAEAVKLVIADMMTPKQSAFPLLPKITVEILGTELIYVPVASAGSEWSQPGTPLTIMKSLLEFGKNL